MRMRLRMLKYRGCIEADFDNQGGIFQFFFKLRQKNTRKTVQNPRECTSVFSWLLFFWWMHSSAAILVSFGRPV